MSIQSENRRMRGEIAQMKDEIAEMRSEIAELQQVLGQTFRSQIKMVEDIALLKALAITNSQGNLVSVNTPKMKEPEPYDGTLDDELLDKFLWDMGEYLGRFPDLPESEKVETAVSYLEDDAKLWWRSRELVKAAGGNFVPCQTWVQFQQIIRFRFHSGNSAWQDIRGSNSKRSKLKHFPFP